MSIFKDWAGKSLRLTKSPQVPRVDENIVYHWMHNAIKSQNIRSHRGTSGAIETLVTTRLQALSQAAMQLGRARSPCLGRLLSFLSRIQLPPLLRLFVPSLFLISMPNFFLQSWITLFFRYLNWIVQLEKGSDLTPVLLSRCSNRCSASMEMRY